MTSRSDQFPTDDYGDEDFDEEDDIPEYEDEEPAPPLAKKGNQNVDDMLSDFDALLSNFKSANAAREARNNEQEKQPEASIGGPSSITVSQAKVGRRAGPSIGDPFAKPSSTAPVSDPFAKAATSVRDPFSKQSAMSNPLAGPTSSSAAAPAQLPSTLDSQKPVSSLSNPFGAAPTETSRLSALPKPAAAAASVPTGGPSRATEASGRGNGNGNGNGGGPQARGQDVTALASENRRLSEDVARARAELERLAGGGAPRPPATGASSSSRVSKPGAKRPRSTPQESEREARQVMNAKKMMAYYAKEAEMLKRKLAKARSADEQLAKLEATVTATEAALSEAQKRGRELLKSQKEQQRLLQAGGSKDDSGRKLSELREDIRIAKERLRMRTEANEADAQQIVLSERKCADLAASMVDLERQYDAHQSQIAAVASKADAEAANRERQACELEAEVEAETSFLEAQRKEQQAQRAKAKSYTRALRAEVARLEELLKSVLQERKRGELKAKQAQERGRIKRERPPDQRAAAELPAAAESEVAAVESVFEAPAAAPPAVGGAVSALEPPPALSLNPHRPLPQIGQPPAPGLAAALGGGSAIGGSAEDMASWRAEAAAAVASAAGAAAPSADREEDVVEESSRFATDRYDDDDFDVEDEVEEDEEDEDR